MVRAVASPIVATATEMRMLLLSTSRTQDHQGQGLLLLPMHHRRARLPRRHRPHPQAWRP